jgi:hypothetical protein
VQAKTRYSTMSTGHVRGWSLFNGEENQQENAGGDLSPIAGVEGQSSPVLQRSVSAAERDEQFKSTLQQQHLVEEQKDLIGIATMSDADKIALANKQKHELDHRKSLMHDTEAFATKGLKKKLGHKMRMSKNSPQNATGGGFSGFRSSLAKGRTSVFKSFGLKTHTEDHQVSSPHASLEIDSAEENPDVAQEDIENEDSPMNDAVSSDGVARRSIWG